MKLSVLVCFVAGEMFLNGNVAGRAPGPVQRVQQLISPEGEDGNGLYRPGQAGGQPSQESAAMQGRLRNPQSDWAWRLRRGVRRTAQERRQGLRPQDTQQMGDAQKGRDGMLPRREGRPRLWGPPVDHQPALCLPGTLLFF